MKKAKDSHLFAHRLRKRGSDTRELAERLAPLEELSPADSKEAAATADESKVVAQENGAIVVGREKPSLPEDALDVSERKGILGLEPVVIVIAGLMLAFIIFIAWQVSRMFVSE